MSTENNITFESDKFKYKSRVILGQTQVPGMTKFLLGKGIVKNEKQAQSVLLIMTILFLLIAIYVLAVFVFGFKQNNNESDQLKIERENLKELSNQKRQ